MTSPRVLAVIVGSVGVGLLSWLLYDASSIVSTVGLTGVVSEASVALVGFALVGTCFVGAIAFLSCTSVASNAL